MARILIAIDFSDCGRSALEAGVGLAKDLGCDIRLVHAFAAPMKVPVAAGLGYQDIFKQYAAQIETGEAIRLTTEWADQARADGIDVDIVADSAEPDDLILEAAQAEDVSIIVIGSHGKSGLKKLMLGSVAQSVVQRSHKPVLVVPSR